MEAEYEEMLNRFRRFRDQYYEVYPNHTDAQRLEAFNERANELVAEVGKRIVNSPVPTHVTIQDVMKGLEDKLSGLPNDPEKLDVYGDKLKFNLVSGCILNVMPQYLDPCEACLTKTVKWDPDNVRGLNELGACLMKKGDIAGARRCFQAANAKEPSAETLSNLASAIRQESVKTSTEQRENARTSLSMSETATKMEPDNPTVWYLMGNACLASFFVCDQADYDIRKAIESYSNAVTISGGEKESYNPDLMHNYAVALGYEEEYGQALWALERAVKLDPHFTDARDKLNSLRSYLLRTQESVAKRGKLRVKRVDELRKGLAPEKDLGPYSGGTMKACNGVILELRFQPSFKALSLGSNKNVIVLGKVVGVVPNQETIPYTFSMVDGDGECVGVTVYNFSADFGLVIGSSVAIVEPYLNQVDVTVQDKCEYVSLRVGSPEVLVVNGKKGEKKQVAPVDITFTNGPQAQG